MEGQDNSLKKTGTLMRKLLIGMLCLITQSIWLMPARASDIPPCTSEQRLAYSPPVETIAVHRQFALPVISYPFGTRKDLWGFSLALRVDQQGRVVCYSATDEFGRPESIDDRRRAEIDRLSAWRYQPFEQDGKPVAAMVSEQIYEQELPQKHVPLPDVSLSKVHISLQRTLCFGTCPAYRVDIYGDGRVVYRGEQFVDVEGEHRYRIAPNEVARLVDSLKAKDIWSLRDSYRGNVTDNPTYVLTLSIGAETHRLEDYVGAYAGMPRVVSDFEREVDRVAQSDSWIHLQQPAVDHLKAEGFRFDSPAAAGILSRSISNDRGRDDNAMLALIELGAPLVGAENPQPGSGNSAGTLIEGALLNHRAVLVDPLIERGALKTNGQPDQKKIDAAFQAAIRGGRLALVEKIWSIRGDHPHPSLTFHDVAGDGGHAEKTAPVTLLLSTFPGRDKGWEGLEIAKWLVAKGCDIQASAADGSTLLHIAAEADDARFVRYLLDQGMNPSTPGRYNLPALGSTRDEDVALMLLQAGTDLSSLNTQGRSFRQYAVSQDWPRVVAWLDAHHQD